MPPSLSVPPELPCILVADAYDDTRALYADLLKELTPAIIEAADGVEALAVAFGRRPALVITDTWLPRIDGWTLCSMLRRTEPVQDTKVLLVSASITADDHRRAEAAGADALLCKPVDMDALLARARAVLADARAPHECVSVARNRAAALHRPISGSGRPFRNRSLSHVRYSTFAPPTDPAVLLCPQCHLALLYIESYFGGVNAQSAEQWDTYDCAECGRFEYRHRTKRWRSADA